MVHTKCISAGNRLTVMLFQLGFMEGIPLMFMEVLTRVESWLKQCMGKRYGAEIELTFLLNTLTQNTQIPDYFKVNSVKKTKTDLPLLLSVQIFDFLLFCIF